MKLLTKEQQKSYENANIFYICKEKFVKLEIIVIIQKNIEVLHRAQRIYNIVLLKNSYSFVIMDHTMMSFYHKRVSGRY